MNITANVVQSSEFKFLWMRSRIDTFVLEYPRYIHGEVMTHRVFSRNAASSRAIPIQDMIQNTIDNKVTPIYWGSAKTGMQAGAEIDDEAKRNAVKIWRNAACNARRSARKLDALGLHKQVPNRLLEPFQMMRVVLTTTELHNFFGLRNHPDAQPEIQQLAAKMLEAYLDTVPMGLKWGEWHVPFVDRKRLSNGELTYWGELGPVLLEDAKVISASVCAQVSFRKEDSSLAKAKAIFKKLIGSSPVHASPVEHQAKPHWLPTLRCRNFVGWRQFRSMINGDTIKHYEGIK